MTWSITIRSKVLKKINKLPKSIALIFRALVDELEMNGPVRGNWKNFSELASSSNVKRYHCHLKKGKPTYVAVWEIDKNEIKIIEITYVGTHEKAPY